MGQGCTKLAAQRISSTSRKYNRLESALRAAASADANVISNAANPATSNTTQAASSASPSTQLCSHNVCSVLRRKEWDATEKMLITGEGVDITMTKFLERALYEGCPTRLLEMILENEKANPLHSSRCLSDAILGKAEYSIIKHLLDIGCSPNQESDQDKHRRTPMHFACQTGVDLDILLLLIERGGDANLKVGERSWTPVHYLACTNHNPEMLAKLVASGGDINARASDLTTPLAVAAYKRADGEFLRVMLSFGADPALKTINGKGPLFYFQTSSSNQRKNSGHSLQVALLDPGLHQNQVCAILHGLHKQFGAQSDLKRLNRDILVHVSEFLLGRRRAPSKCDNSAREEIEEV